jgi:hypothetical protein
MPSTAVLSTLKCGKRRRKCLQIRQKNFNGGVLLDLLLNSGGKSGLRKINRDYSGVELFDFSIHDSRIYVLNI